MMHTLIRTLITIDQDVDHWIVLILIDDNLLNDNNCV